MNFRILRRLLLAVCAVAFIGSVSIDLLGFATYGRVWGTSQVIYYVNTNNKWVSPSDAIAAFQQAADVWDQQTQANIKLIYGGTTSGSSMTMNYKNEVFFRNDANGTIAEAYFWWDGSGKIVDADIVLHEGGYQFHVGSGCTNGIYVEDVAVHEFGHVLGLAHSADPAATMAASMPGMCDRSQLVLEQDDITGLESLYSPSQSVQPPSTPSLNSVVAGASNPTSSLTLSWSNVSSEDGYRVERSTDGASFAQIAQFGTNVTSYTNTGLPVGTTFYYRVSAYNSGGASTYSNVLAGQTQNSVSTNTAPSVSITAPAINASYPQFAAITFSGTANDSQEGNLANRLAWTSSIDGNIGTGASFSRTLSVGTHSIRATATDSGNLTGSSEVTVTVTGSASGGRTLNARSYKVKSSQRVELTWSGAQTGSVDIYRNGAVMRTTANDGLDTDSPNKRSSSYTYKICDAGTANCSNQVNVTF